MKKIFIVSGEVSGDKVAAWYLKKLKKIEPDVESCAVGGDFLESAGALLYERMEKLNVVGLIEIIKRLRFILNFLKQLSNHILQGNFDVKLAKKLKKLNPNLKITYLSPPQLWAWGQWRIKKLKKYCDKLIVLYPFEVEWYKSRGLQAEFLSNPICDNLQKYLSMDLNIKENQIAIVPGSRESEIEKLFVIFADIVKRFKLVWPNVKVVLPLAESFSANFIESKMKKAGLWRWGSDIKIVRGEKEKLEALSKCCLAITKPGTVSLELALLRVPSVVLYKASWLTYLIAKSLVKIEHMALPNLLLSKPIYKEFIQRDCKTEAIFKEASKIYKNFITKNDCFKYLQSQFIELEQKLL